MQILLSTTQAGPSRAGKQQQEQVSAKPRTSLLADLGTWDENCIKLFQKRVSKPNQIVPLNCHPVHLLLTHWRIRSPSCKNTSLPMWVFNTALKFAALLSSGHFCSAWMISIDESMFLLLSAEIEIDTEIFLQIGCFISIMHELYRHDELSREIFFIFWTSNT